jgi:peroxiredoxin
MLMSTAVFSIGVIVVILAFPAQGPTVGQQAPDFSLPYATKDSIANRELRLSSVVGTNKIVLAFYPADWSGGCTKEMCAMRDDFTVLSKLGVTVLGISGDYVFSHHAWAKELGLPFALLSDPKREVARLYESYNEETGYVRRTLYVVDHEGRIAYMDPAYDVSTTASFERLKEALRKLD